jgi:hypothetical protein
MSVTTQGSHRDDETDAAAAAPEVVHDAKPRSEDVIDLRFLFISWLKWIWVPVLLGLFGLYQGYQDLKLFTPQYVASMVVQPSGSDAHAASAGMAVQSLAAEFGIQVGPQAASVRPFDRLELLLGSIALAERLQEKHSILQVVFSGAWDEGAQDWKRPSGEDFERDQRIRAFFRQNLWQPPNLETVAQYVEGKISVVPIRSGAFQRLSVTHPDRDYAQWLLTTSYYEADELLRERDKAESAGRKAYIERQLEGVTLLHIQEALRSLLASELAREVALAGDQPYVAKIVEQPRVSNTPTDPNLTVIFGVPVSTLAGLGFLLITFIAVLRRERSR